MGGRSSHPHCQHWNNHQISLWKCHLLIWVPTPNCQGWQAGKPRCCEHPYWKVWNTSPQHLTLPSPCKWWNWAVQLNVQRIPFQAQQQNHSRLDLLLGCCPVHRPYNCQTPNWYDSIPYSLWTGSSLPHWAWGSYLGNTGLGSYPINRGPSFGVSLLN